MVTGLIEWTETKIKQLVKEYLAENLCVEVYRGDFTDPNSREIKIYLGEKLLCRTSFDVVQKREYEG